MKKIKLNEELKQVILFSTWVISYTYCHWVQLISRLLLADPTKASVLNKENSV